MDVSDVMASDEERTWINRVTSEIVFQPLHPDTGAPVHEERVIAVREEPNCTLSSTSVISLMECGQPWTCLVLVVSKSFQKMVKITRKLENTVRTVFGLGFHSFVLKDVDHDALCLTLLNEIRQPGAHAPNLYGDECDEYFEKRLSSFGSTQHVCKLGGTSVVVCPYIVDGVMEKVYIVFDDDTEHTSIAEIGNFKTCELPDGNIITFGAEDFHCTEVLLQPSLLGKGPRYNIDTRKNLYANVELHKILAHLCRAKRWHGRSRRIARAPWRHAHGWPRE